MKLILIIALFSSPLFAKTKRSVFEKSLLRESAKGDRLILRFRPKVPKIRGLYYRKKKMSILRWRARAKKSVVRKYLFSDPRSEVSKMIVSIDKRRQKGALLIWHKKRDSFRVTRRNRSQLIVYIKKTPKKKKLKRKLASEKKKGPRLTLNVKNTNLDKVLRTLASAGGRNIVFGDDVAGSVTVNIRDLTYEDAVNTVLKPTNFRASHQEDVTVVSTADKVRTFRVFRWKHVDISQVIETVRGIATGAEISIDSSTNSMFVVASENIIRRIAKTHKELDVSPKQVEVEAAIVELQNRRSQDIGVDVTGPVISGDVSNPLRSSVAPFDFTSTSNKGFYVGLSWRSVGGFLGLLKSSGDVTVIARPRIVALSDEEADIHIGDRLGYRTITVTENGNVENVSFLTVGTSLKIRPHITRSGDVLMNLEPEVSDGSVDPATQLPQERTTSSKTKVLAKSGQTIVIGGLLRDRTEINVTKIPILGDIPLIGFFFRGTKEANTKSEIMILLAPKVVDANLVRSQNGEAKGMVHRIYSQRASLIDPPARFLKR